jgi:hypothetical protein
MESKIDYGHSLLQSRPNFAKALKDFETFLTATQDDLQRKFRILNEQRSNRKTSRNVKTYLTLQNFLLQKHVHRLNEFQTEILRCGSCHLERALNIEIGVEYQKIFIFFFFKSSDFLRSTHSLKKSSSWF